MPLKTIKTNSLGKKILLAAAGITSLAVLFFFAKWLFGNSISTQAENKEVAEFAVGLAPNDPQTHFALAVMNERSFLPEDLPRSLAEYEKATSLSPNDYRLWLSLGKAKERAGDIAGAENALQRAIALAPNYSEVRWAYGNVLLRQGKTAAAFKEIRAAVDNDPKFVVPAANTAWQILGGDITRIRQTIGNSYRVNSALAVFLATQERFDEALEIWNSLPKDKLKNDLKPDGERLAQLLLGAGKLRKSLEIQGRISSSPNDLFTFESVTNGGFESNVKTANTSIFDWKIGDGAEPQINIAGDQKHSGSRSLVLNFKVTKQAEFREISQTVAVNGGTSYLFELYYKSDLDTSDTVAWEIVNRSSWQVLASTDPVEAKAEWTRTAVEFGVPPDLEGVLIRLVRSGCESVVCPINGRVWFDDIAIKKAVKST